VGCEDPQDAWPKALEKLLNKERNPSDPRVEVLNAGLNYALTPELLIHYMLVGQHLEPDIVVLEGPGNDWLPVALGDESSDYSRSRGVGRTPQPRFGERVLVRHSYGARLALALWLKFSDSTGLVSLEPPDIDWNADETLQRLKDSTFEYYEANLTSLIALCASRGVDVILVPFVTSSEAELRRSRPNKSRFVSGQLKAIHAQNEIMKHLASAHGPHVRFVGDPPHIPVDEFIDGIHMTVAGDVRKAQWIAPVVAEVLGERVKRDIRIHGN